MSVKALANVHAVLCWRLNKEPSGYDISGRASLREYNVSELLFCSQLVKGWLLQKLQRHLVQKVKSPSVICIFASILVVRDQAGVLVLWFRHCKFQPMEVVWARAQVDDTHIVQIILVHSLHTSERDSLLDYLLCLVFA